MSSCRRTPSPRSLSKVCHHLTLPLHIPSASLHYPQCTALHTVYVHSLYSVLLRPNATSSLLLATETLLGTGMKCSDIITAACYTLNTVSCAEPMRKPLSLYYGSRDIKKNLFYSFMSHMFLLKLLRRNWRRELSHIFGQPPKTFFQLPSNHPKHPFNYLATRANTLQPPRTP